MHFRLMCFKALVARAAHMTPVPCTRIEDASWRRTAAAAHACIAVMEAAARKGNGGRFRLHQRPPTIVANLLRVEVLQQAVLAERWWQMEVVHCATPGGGHAGAGARVMLTGSFRRRAGRPVWRLPVLVLTFVSAP